MVMVGSWVCVEITREQIGTSVLGEDAEANDFFRRPALYLYRQRGSDVTALRVPGLVRTRWIHVAGSVSVGR